MPHGYPSALSGATSASFVYDGDGILVKSVMGGVTTGNVGNSLCQALAESLRGGNGFVLAGGVCRHRAVVAGELWPV